MPDLAFEFGQIVVAHALAVASPGPDFALVLRQSLRHGRRAALFTSFGIGAGILVHVSYSILGLGLFLRTPPAAFQLLKYTGAAYLAWLGVQALRSAQLRGTSLPKAPSAMQAGRHAWLQGFMTNALNVKATLFFLALFPTVVSATTPKWVQVGYGLWMAAATAAWFSFVSLVFTHEAARRAFLRHSHWIDRLLGVVFLGFAVGLVWASV